MTAPSLSDLLRRRARLAGLALLTALAAAAAPALAAPPAAPSGSSAPPGKGARGGGLDGMGNSKEPIAIDADRLDVFDKEGRAVFTGNVVSVQGDTTMKCTVMQVFYEPGRVGGGGQRTASAQPSGGGLSNDNIKRIDCAGPVTITTKTQVATGDRAEFDKPANKVYLIGNAVLNDGPNVTKGERVIYDMNSGVANVEGGRVRALIVPGSEKDKDPKEAKDKPKEAKTKGR